MVRGRYSPGRSSYQSSSGRLNSSWSSGGSHQRDYRPTSGKLSSYSSNSSERKHKYPSDRYSSSSRPHFPPNSHRKPYRPDSGYVDRRDNLRSPERKRMRTEASSSRIQSSHSGYGSSRRTALPPPSSSSNRRRYSDDRRPSSSSLPRREEFHRPTGPPNRITDRRYISSRSSRGLNPRERPGRRRLERPYAVRRRNQAIARRAEYTRKMKIARMRRLIDRRAAKRKPSHKSSDRERSKENKDKESREKDRPVKDIDTEEPKKDIDVKKDSKSESEDEKGQKKKSYIDLTCPHCEFKALTFRRYEMHLTSRKHLIAMRKLVQKQKSILSQMRLAQRNAQNELEIKGEGDLTKKTSFCPLCKLNYKQKKAVHQETEAHKNMKKFLMPHCKVCNITFKSPMVYESHCCSIRHLKRKERVESSSDVSEDEVDLANFTTIDSIGEEGSDGEENKEPVSIGIEQIQKIEVYFCNLCKMDLPKGDESDVPKILAKHCKTRLHMKRYIRFKEDKDLEKRAEELQRKELAEKEGNKDETHPDEKDKTIKFEDDGMDEKQLSEILIKTDDKSSDDEDDSHVNGERYDRFKLSEKNDEENENTSGKELNGIESKK